MSSQVMDGRLRSRRLLAGVLFVTLLAGGGDVVAKSKKAKGKEQAVADPYAEYVWPPPPNPARIKLDAVYHGRADVEATTKWRKKLLGAAPGSEYDELNKPFAVAFDAEGRILVTDTGHGALLRFDPGGERYDVLGTKGSTRLRSPMGLDIAADGTVYVADVSLNVVVAFDPEGGIVGVYGQGQGLDNPTDVAVSPDGKSLFLADSKQHRIVVLSIETGEVVRTFGEHGDGPGQFAWPTSLTFGPEGDLFVVDQINSRVQVLGADGAYLGEFGKLGVGFANFVRPKDVAVDEVGFIYVTDFAFNNVQIFDADFTLLTFVGKGGRNPGEFFGASGVAVQGDRFAVVDQLGARVQVFRFIVPKDQ